MSLFDTVIDELEDQARALAAELERLPLPERIEALNRIRTVLHAASPFAAEPIDCVLWLPCEQIHGNDYNPNHVAPPEMRLLTHSIAMDGYTQPVVGWRNGQGIAVVDGEHRTRVGKENKAIRRRLHGYLPLTLIKSERAGRNDRIAATIRHNRARGVHGVLPMSEIVAELLRLGWQDDEIAKELGMDADEVLRFKQTTGIADLFADHPYSHAWE